jgi:DNA-binding MarR family transcriptional regulator
MTKKEILLTLVDRLFEYSPDNTAEDAYNMEDFLAYAHAQVAIPSNEQMPLRDQSGQKEDWLNVQYGDDNRDISILLVLLFRYAKTYIKKALQSSSIQTADEFVVLITLLTHESLTKTALVNKLVIEKTSGAEVIKRMLNLKLIRQFEDEVDKRSIRVSITALGRKTILKVIPKMYLVSQVVAGNLSPQEKNTLSFLMKKLDYHHHFIFMNQRHEKLEDLVPEKENK